MSRYILAKNRSLSCNSWPFCLISMEQLSGSFVSNTNQQTFKPVARHSLHTDAIASQFTCQRIIRIVSI